METDVVDLLIAGDRIDGVRLASGEEIRAKLTIAADGRTSVLRDKADLPRKVLSAPIDVLWFRLPKTRTETNVTGGTFGAGAMVVEIDRGVYWQCAYVVAKGAVDDIRAKGIEAFRRDVARAAPELAPAIETLQGWDQVKLLAVTLDRLTRWWRPGLLAIGDAAHAMSPVGGVGINLAIQDAVAAANILAQPLEAGENVDAVLAKVQARRMFPTRVIQAGQKLIHDRVLTPLVVRKVVLDKVPFVLKLFQRFPVLRRIPARLVGLGIRREHVHSPNAGVRRAEPPRP